MTKHPLKKERPGISSDDPQAIEKLKAKVAEFEAKIEHMKAVNAYYKANGTFDGCPGVTPEEAAERAALMERDPVENPRPYSKKPIDNAWGSLRWLRLRIVELERRQSEPPPEGWRFDGGEVVIDMAANCIRVVFDERPDTDRIIELKIGGFIMAYLGGPWEREYSARGLDITKRLFAKL